jgi:hypothetical protein
MRNECYRGPKLGADLSLVDVSRKRVCVWLVSNMLVSIVSSQLTGQNIILQKSLVVLRALFGASS